MMNKLSSILPAYILHSRPYSETSILAELLTEQGRLSCIIKGARKIRSPWLGLIQLFQPLWVQYVGKYELKTLTLVEAKDKAYQLQGNALYSGLYLNELLIKLFSRDESSSALLNLYETALKKLQACASEPDNLIKIEIILRNFELQLLEELGLALTFNQTFPLNLPILPQVYYSFRFGEGLHEVPASQKNMPYCYLGELWLALAKKDFSQPETLKCAKAALRYVIDCLIGHKKICSRALFARRTIT